jgi:cell division protein FtsZ
VVEKILAHPLFEEGRVLMESDAVLISLKAGKDLTMAEVNRVMEKINRQCGRAKIIMGASVDPEFKNRLCVTVIAAKGGGSAPTGGVRPETGTATSHSAGRRSVTTESGGRKRAVIKKPVQGQLPLNIIAKSRFDKSEPTLHRGEDLDVPTFIRRGLALN